MAFITTKQQIKEANSSVTVDLSVESMQSFLNSAEDMFRAILGVTPFAELEGKTSTLAYKRMQSTIVNMALHLYADSGQLLISDSGMQVSKSASLLPASDKKIISFKRGVFKAAWQSFEAALKFMDSLKDEYPIWFSSPEYKNYFNSLISYTSIFNFDSRIGITEDVFQMLRSEIRAVEQDQIIPLLGAEVYETLVDAIKAGSTIDVQDKCIAIARKAITSLSLAGCIPYLLIEITSNGVFQISESALSSQSDNIQEKSIPQTRALQRTMNRLISVGEGELETLRSFMNKNIGSFSGYESQQIAPMASFNDDLKDSNVYFF